uniref:Golgi apparatus membrane protein TVP38 n=1 Tax=Mycena chlorophos TaxID=658473 RepID=A0ABQ0M3U6_MYCCL|nr:predicted protein [Mycena chlorophos]
MSGPYLSPAPERNYAYMPTHNRGDPSIGESISMLHEDDEEEQPQGYSRDPSQTTLTAYDSRAGQSQTTLYDPPRGYPPDYPAAPRTPSPTPSEVHMLNGTKAPKTTKQIIIKYTIIAVLVALTVVISIEQNNIVNGLKPVTNFLKGHPYGPIIIILIFVIISFPPLFGQEIVSILVGVTWSLPVAFAIVAAGILLGEIANFFTFKYFFTARSQKMQDSTLSFALLAQVVREGGFLIAVIVRYSAIPSHFATVIFATCGLSFWTFLAAAVVSLPQSLVPVYIGYTMDHASKTGTLVNRIVLVISIIITIVALRYIQAQEKKVAPEVIYQRRKARAAKMLQTAYDTQAAKSVESAV